MQTGYRSAIPDLPGVYHMLRKNGDLLYVGKAKSLRSRVASYFQPGQRHAEKTLEMLTQAKALQVTPTGSALEAALLEVEQIQNLSPAYNIALQPKRRPLRFSTVDFTQYSEHPDRHHRLGPLSDVERFKALGQLGQWLHRARIAGSSAVLYDGSIDAAIFGFDPPDEQTLQAGLTSFREQFYPFLEETDLYLALRRIGRHLLVLQATDDTETSAEGEGDDQDAGMGAENGWTAERVCRRLQSLVRHCTRDLYRARWFCRISESVLAWPCAVEVDEKVVLTIGRGRVSVRDTFKMSDTLPAPPGYKARQIARQRYFDANTYDRLRVLTTEIRRLVAAGRPIELRVSPGRTLTSERLASVLKYV